MNELTKIIFEKLGIEPGEVFQIQHEDNIYIFDEHLNLMTCIKSSNINGYCWYDAPADFLRSLINGQLKISKPLLTDEEKEFLNYFGFDTLKKVEGRAIIFSIYTTPTNSISYTLGLNALKLRFDGLEFDKEYSKEELGL